MRRPSSKSAPGSRPPSATRQHENARHFFWRAALAALHRIARGNLRRLFGSIRVGGVIGAGMLVSGCHREAVDEDPERLVREFIVRMQRVHGDQKNARAVFELLWGPAQRNLTERAARASALAGRKVAPEEMIAPSRFTLRFESKRISSSTTADRAIVTVQGDPPQRETREVRCVREDGRWRVVLDFPVLPPIQKRPETVKDE